MIGHVLMISVGQLAQYLHGAELKYGFLTTYEDTVFVKVEGVMGSSLCFTAMPSATMLLNSMDLPRRATFMQCFEYIASLAAGNPRTCIQCTRTNGRIRRREGQERERRVEA